jgi:hypothetical protein
MMPRLRDTCAWLAPAIGALALVVGCGGAASPAPSRADPAAAATLRTARLTVLSAPVGSPVPSGFMGLSIEPRGLASYAGLNPRALNPVFIQLLRNLSPDQSPVLRIGGDGTDWTWVPIPHVARPPGVRYDLTSAWLQTAKALAQTLNARLILGVNLEANSTKVAGGEARAMLREIGSKWIRAFEIGNEPELYGTFSWYTAKNGRHVDGRPRTYNFAAFLQDYTRFARVMPAQVQLAGPASGGPLFLQQLGQFARAEPRARLLTIHRYPLKQCSSSAVVTMSELLADSSSNGLAAGLAPYIAVARAHHAPLRVDEMNAVSCGGTRGVSDTFGSALWALETLFALARSGVDGVNFHSVPDTINELIGAEFVSGHWRSAVQPQYYGMLMFAQAAPAGARLLRIAGAQPVGTHTWATRAPNGQIHVVLINDNLSKAESVNVRIPSEHGPGALERLRAASVNATSGVTLGGQSFGSQTSTGQLAGTSTAGTVTPNGAGYAVSLPPASAAMLTLGAGS